MDTFKIVLGLISFVLLFIFYFLISTFIKFIKRKESFKNLFTSFITFFIILLISIILLLFFSPLQTFSRFSYEEKIGEVYATKTDNLIKIIYAELKTTKICV
ncbi:MAG: hypothetical protein QMD25_00430 [Caldisericia bacterium]|jgi:glucan phosphoethanolaminetransferase (alkaline phosphatase superfamily)|nr:hypothetical protein [Caldisericia bacterium]